MPPDRGLNMDVRDVQQREVMRFQALARKRGCNSCNSDAAMADRMLVSDSDDDMSMGSF